MSEEQELEEVVEESPAVEEAQEEKAPPPKKEAPKAKVLPKENHQVFRVGETLEVEGLPFAVKEVRGVDLVLKRTDMK